ncbi:rho-associated protein kinase let-502 [Monomorium pharaonis]|uniref:rho-associated protein kinase let-502 n=1 Tax=Monomorium pharaonis TaxID=307658 RepID=UPI00063F24CA|nr:rho-associated protein kinase let-502 [Monomorium pharaonis]XP_012536790.1 rho-associated protein kinase let-502 [Monomorium pharaonis]
MFCTSRKSRELECAGRDESPTRLEIERSLGTSLAQILYHYSHQEAAKLLKSLPLTKISQQPCCAVQDGPLEADARKQILKSYIHNDILTLGEDELKKFQTEIEAATQKKLKDEFAMECHMLEAEKIFAIRRNADEIHAKYEEYFKFAQQELEEKLQIELADENTKRNKELQKAIVKARMDTTHDVLRKIRPQINWIVTSLYNELEQIRRGQKEKMIADFNIIMRNQYLKLDARIKEIERQKMEELRIQRHELEMRNVTNIIYVFCLERLRSGSRLQAIYKHFEEKVKSLHELIAKQEETMNTMREKITKYRNKNKTLQEKINALSKEFQKFINFAFDSLPEHADFLLPLDLLSVNSANEEDSEQEKKQ